MINKFDSINNILKNWPELKINKRIITISRYYKITQKILPLKTNSCLPK